MLTLRARVVVTDLKPLYQVSDTVMNYGLPAFDSYKIQDRFESSPLTESP